MDARYVARYEEAINNKQRRCHEKEAIIGAIIIISLIACVKPVYMYYEQKQEEKRLIQEPYFIEYGLLGLEYYMMATKYYVEEKPYWWENPDKEDWSDYGNYTMEPTEDTEMAETVLDSYLLDKREASN